MDSKSSDKIKVENSFRSIHSSPGNSIQDEQLAAVSQPASVPHSVPLSAKIELQRATGSPRKKALFVGTALASLATAIGFLLFKGQETAPQTAVDALPEETEKVASAAATTPPAAVLPATTTAIAFEKSYFAYNSADLSADSKAILQKAAAEMQRHPNEKFRIAGYADEIGSPAFNLALSELRAKSAQTYLVGLGAPAHQFQLIAFGETRPAVKGKAESARKWNRRVEISQIKRATPATAKR